MTHLVKVNGKNYEKNLYESCECCHEPMIGIMEKKARKVCDKCCDRYELNRFGEQVKAGA